MVGIDVTTNLFLLHDDVTVQGRQRRLRLRNDADNMMAMLLLLALPNYNYIAIHVCTYFGFGRCHRGNVLASGFQSSEESANQTFNIRVYVGKRLGVYAHVPYPLREVSLTPASRQEVSLTPAYMGVR